MAATKREGVLPEVPTLIEQGVPDFQVLAWTGLYAPAGTPPSVIAKLNQASNQVLRSPEFAQWLKAFGPRRRAAVSKRHASFSRTKGLVGRRLSKRLVCSPIDRRLATPRFAGRGS